MTDSEKSKNPAGYNLKVIQIVQRIPLLQGLDSDSFKVLLKLANLMRFNEKEAIIQENRYDATIYFLLEGTVAIVKNNREVTMIEKVGDFFGEMASIEGLPRSASVIAKTDCTVLALDSELFDSLDLEGMDQVSKKFYKIFSERLSRRLREVGEENARLTDRIKYLEEVIDRRGSK